MLIRASTQVFLAGALNSPTSPSVTRVKGFPLTVTLAEAHTVLVPGTSEVRVVLASPSASVTLVAGLRVPTPVLVKYTVIFWAFTQPEPSLTSTLAVSTWSSPAGLVSSSCEMLIRASMTFTSAVSVASTASPSGGVPVAVTVFIRVPKMSPSILATRWIVVAFPAAI